MSEQVITCPRCAGACFAATLSPDNTSIVAAAAHDNEIHQYIMLECQRCCKQVLQFVVDLSPEFARS